MRPIVHLPYRGRPYKSSLLRVSIKATIWAFACSHRSMSFELGVGGHFIVAIEFLSERTELVPLEAILRKMNRLARRIPIKPFQDELIPAEQICNEISNAHLHTQQLFNELISKFAFIALSSSSLFLGIAILSWRVANIQIKSLVQRSSFISSPKGSILFPLDVFIQR